MAYQKRYRAVVPVPREQANQDDLLVWLTRESFDRQAAGDCLQLVEFTDRGELAPDDIPPLAEKQLGAPAADFVWRSFEGVGQRAVDA